MGKKGSKKSDHDEGHGHKGWAVSFCDLVMVLFAFFVLLFSMGSMDDKQFSASFGVLVTPVEVLQTGGDGGSFVEPITPTQFTGPEAGPFDTEDSVVVTFEEIIKQKNLEAVKLYKTNKGVVLQVAEAVLFDPLQTELKPAARTIMDRLIPLLNQVQFPMYIEGYTADGLPARSAFSSDWDLSAQRALNALFYLMQHSTIEQQQLSFRGYSAENIASGQSAGENKNCIEIIIDTKQTTK